MTKADNARYVRESRARRKAEGMVRVDIQVPARDVVRLRRIAQHMRAEYELDKNREEKNNHE